MKLRTAIARRALVAVLAALPLAGCAVGPSSRPPIAVGDGPDNGSTTATPTSPPPVPGLEDMDPSGIIWEDCTETTTRLVGPGRRFECATTSSRLDPPAAPGRGSVRLSLLKAGSGSTPLVVVNDIAGEPGTTFTARLAGGLPEEVLAEYALIGLDRRVSGTSDGASCVRPETRRELIDADPRAADQASLTGVLEAARNATQQCALDLNDRLPAYDSWRTASDLEQLREDLGVSRLNLLGLGEGSRAVSMFAERFPTAVGRVVLDGIPEPELDSIAQHESIAKSAESTLAAFAAECRRQSCPLGAEPGAAVDEVTVRGSGRLSAGASMAAVLAGLKDRSRWPELWAALAAARTGSPEGLARFVLPRITDSDDYPAPLDAELITTCNDTSTRVPPERVAALAAQWKNDYPMFGAYFAQRLLWCNSWPVPEPRKPARAVGAPPIIVVATEHDPRTPREGTTRAAKLLSSAVLLQWQGAGHGAYPTSACVSQAVNRFLLEARVPTDGTACPP